MEFFYPIAKKGKGGKRKERGRMKEGRKKEGQKKGRDGRKELDIF